MSARTSSELFCSRDLSCPAILRMRVLAIIIGMVEPPETHGDVGCLMISCSRGSRTLSATTRCWTAILAESRFQIGAYWIHLGPVGAISHRFMDLVRLALLVDLSAHLPEEVEIAAQEVGGVEF